MKIEVISPLELGSADLRTWARLQDADRALASPFLSPGWSMALAKTDGPDRGRARVAVVSDGGAPGEALGFFVARVNRFTAMPCGGPMSDYQGLVGGPELPLDPRDLVRALGVQRLDLVNTLEAQTSFAPFAHGRCESRVIDIADGFDAYAKARRAAGSDVLQDAAKKRRKLEREHGQARFTARSTSAADLRMLLDWKGAQCRATGQTDIFEAGWTGRLIERLHAEPEPGCEGALFTLHVGERLAAAHFALIGRGVIHAWFIAHDEAFAKYSPGVMLIADILKWAGEQGLREMDLGPGDYRFKLQLANATRGIVHGFVGRPSPATLVRSVQYGVRHAVEALPIGRYAELPAKAMRRLDRWRGLR